MGGAMMMTGAGGKQTPINPYFEEAKRRTFNETWDLEKQRSKDPYYYRSEAEWQQASEAKLRDDNSVDIQWYDDKKYGGNWEIGFNDEKSKATTAYWGKLNEHLQKVLQEYGLDADSSLKYADAMTDFSGTKQEMNQRTEQLVAEVEQKTAEKPAEKAEEVGAAQEPVKLASQESKTPTQTVLTSPGGAEGHDVPKRKSLLGG